jgi:hypothetical protein
MGLIVGGASLLVWRGVASDVSSFWNGSTDTTCNPFSRVAVQCRFEEGERADECGTAEKCGGAFLPLKTRFHINLIYTCLWSGVVWSCMPWSRVHHHIAQLVHGDASPILRGTVCL